MTEPAAPLPAAPATDGARLTVELGYRSEVSLLVAYATHLVKGQLVVETSAPAASGTPVALRLRTPSTSIAVDGVVSWSRGEPAGRAQPAGMAVAVEAPPPSFGEAVDRLAFEFRGIRALVVTSQPAPRALLSRYLRAIVTCDVVEIDQHKIAEPGAIGDVDLTVIDLDSSGAAGYEVYAQLRQHPAAGSAPVLALAQLERDRARAASLGFDEALSNPPAFAELQAAALRCLARPITVKLTPLA